MAKYEIKAPDGSTYQIEGPEGASQDEVIAAVLAQNPDAGTAYIGANPQQLMDRSYENGVDPVTGEKVNVGTYTGTNLQERAKAKGWQGLGDLYSAASEAGGGYGIDPAAKEMLGPVVGNIVDYGVVPFQALGYGSEALARSADQLSALTGAADALSWEGNKFLPGSAAMALGEAFPLGGMEAGLTPQPMGKTPDSPDPLAAVASATPDVPALPSMPKEVQGDIAARIDAGQSVAQITEAHPAWMDIPGNKEAAQWYVANRAQGGAEPVQFTGQRTDIAPGSAEAQLQQEAQDFSQRQEAAPTPEDLWPSEETLRAREAALEADLQAEADAWKNKNQPLPEVTPESVPARVQSVIDEVDSVIGQWKTDPDITVVSKTDEIPDPVVRERIAADAATGAKGVTLDNGQVYIIADNLTDPTDVKAVLYHEALGHKGMSALFQERLDGLLTKIYDTTGDFRDKVDTWMKENPGAYLDSPNRVARAADEVFANMSEGGPLTAKFMDVVKNYIKNMARKAGLKDIEFSDREIRTILAMAHDAVIKGKPGNVVANGYRYSRGDRIRVSAQAAKTFLRELGVFNNSELMRMPSDEASLRASRLGIDQDWLDYYNDAQWSPETGLSTPTPRPDMSRYLPEVKYSNGKKFSTSPESMRTVNDLDDVLTVLGKEAEDLSGGPRSIREIERAAEDLGLTSSKYLRGKSLEDQNLAAQIMGAKQLLTNTVEELAQLADKAKNEGMTPTLRANIAGKLATARAIYAKFDGDTSELGRAFRTLQEVTESRRSGKAVLRFMDEQQNVGPLTDEALLEAINVITKTEGPEAAARAINRAGKLHWEDYAGSVVYNSMLSSPVTWIKNFAGSPMNFISDLAVDAAASGASKMLPKEADRITSGEIAARLFGPLNALRSWKTYQNIGNAFYTGRSRTPGFEGKIGNRGPVFKGVASGALEFPTRVMAGVDEIWSNLFFHSNFSGEAVRAAVRTGKTGQALKDEIIRLTENPTPEILKAAQDTTNRQLFRDAPSGVGQTLLDVLTPRFEPEVEMRMTQDPVTGKMRTTSYLKKEADSQAVRGAKFAGRLAIPFVPTLDSIARTIIRNSGPVALLSKEIRRDLMTPGIKRQSALSRIGIASAALGYFGYLTSQGLMTGMETEPWQEGQARSAVKPPMSIKIGDEWVSYAGYDPIAGQMAAAATVVERAKKTGEVISSGNLAALAAGMAEALIHSSYAESLLNSLKMVEEGRELVQEGETAGAATSNFVAGQAANVLNPAFVRWVNQEFLDPASRDTSADGTLLERIQARASAGTPGLSEGLPQKFDVFGRPTLNPRQERQVESDPTVLEINRLEQMDDKIILGPPDRTIYKNTDYQTKLTSEQYQMYQQYSGGWTVEDVASAMASPEWQTMTDEDKIDWIKKIRDDAREAARNQLFPIEDNGVTNMEEGL